MLHIKPVCQAELAGSPRLVIWHPAGFLTLVLQVVQVCEVRAFYQPCIPTRTIDDVVRAVTSTDILSPPVDSSQVIDDLERSKCDKPPETSTHLIDVISC